VTGRAAAQILGHQEPVDQFPIFVENWHYTHFQLRLEPDPKGPLVFLRPFGSGDTFCRAAFRSFVGSMSPPSTSA
jgi:hypothetical protein